MKRMARVASGFPGYKITWKSSTFEWFHTDDTFLRKVFFVEFNEMSMENVQWNGGTIFLRIFFSIQFWWWIESTFFCTSQLWTLARSNPSCSKFQQILFYSWNRIFIWTLWVHYFHKKVTLNPFWHCMKRNFFACEMVHSSFPYLFYLTFIRTLCKTEFMLMDPMLQ